MRSIKRGFRNFYRHPLKNLVVIILLFVCLTFSLSMLAVKMAADSQIEEVKQSVGNYGEITVSSDYQMSYFEEMRSMDESERQSMSRTMTEEEMQAQRALFLVAEETADLLADEAAVVTYDKVLSQSIELDGIENTAMQSMLGMREEMRGGEGGPSISSTSYTFEGNTNGASAADFLTGDKALVEGSFYTYKDYLDANPGGDHRGEHGRNQRVGGGRYHHRHHQRRERQGGRGGADRRWASTRRFRPRKRPRPASSLPSTRPATPSTRPSRWCSN